MCIKIVYVLNVCLLFNFVNCEKYLNFLNIDENGDNISHKCIIKIIRSNISCGNLITVVTEINVDSLLEAISQGECYSVIARTFDSRQWLVINEYVVVMANDIMEFENGIINLRKDLFWNTDAKYIIQISNIWNCKDVTKVLLKYNIFNAVFMSNSQESGGLVYTYYPFKYGNCAGDHDTVVPLGLCKDNISLFNIFPNKIPDKFDKCTIRVVRHKEIPYVILESSNYNSLRDKHLPGLEEYIVESIGDYKGYLIDYIQAENKTTYGVVLPNGTVTGVLKYLDTKEADISIGGLILTLNRVNRFDYLWGHFFGAFDVFTAPKTVNRWKLVYKEFSLLSWLVIAAFYCLFVAILNIYSITGTLLKDRVLLVLELWGYFCGNTSETLRRNKKIRVILANWIWFTFLISNFYNTAFYSLTTGQSKHIHHIVAEKFDMNIYKPCINDAARMYFKVTYNKTWPKNNLTMCNEKAKTLKIVASRNDLFSVETQVAYLMNEQKYIDDEGNHMLNVWKSSRITTVHAIFMTRGFPLKETVLDGTRHLVETGLLQAHVRAIYLSTLKAVHAKQKPFKNIDIGTIRVAFGLLFGGLIIASITLILEVVYKKAY